MRLTILLTTGLLGQASAATAQQGIDLTDGILNAKTPDCAAYAGSYHSHVTDVGRDMAFAGDLTITPDGDVCTFAVNQIPNHDFGGVRWPFDVAENTETLRIPQNPQLADSATPVSLTHAAILLNGVKWEPNPAACFGIGGSAAGRERIGCGPRDIENPWRYNVGNPLNEFRFDAYHAHVQQGGMYHYHGTPRVLYSADGQLFDDAACAVAGPSPVIGFALDGFPLFGPCFTAQDGTVRAARSSYAVKSGERQAVDGYETPFVAGVVETTTYNGQFTGDYAYVAGKGDLDACNGQTVDGTYGYYVTQEFPYAVRCFSGTPIIPAR